MKGKEIEVALGVGVGEVIKIKITDKEMIEMKKWIKGMTITNFNEVVEAIKDKIIEEDNFGEIIEETTKEIIKEISKEGVIISSRKETMLMKGIINRETIVIAT